MSEFWFRMNRDQDSVAGVKKVASVAHAAGKTLVAAESFTSVAQEANWVANPYLLKSLGDLAFANGLNQIYLHSYTDQPYAGVAPGFAMARPGPTSGGSSPGGPRPGPGSTTSPAASICSGRADRSPISSLSAARRSAPSSTTSSQTSPPVTTTT